MAEDFLTYTELDNNSHITRTSSRVTAAGLSAVEDAYVYKDKGENSFSGNFTHLITVEVTEATTDGRFYFWALTNTVNDMKGISDGGGSFLTVFLFKTSTNYQLVITECDSGSSASDAYNISLNTPYYLKIVRDESEEAHGKIYCYIYSDEARTILLETISQMLKTSKKDYQYIFSCNTRNSSIGGRTISGYCENLILQDASEPTVTTQAVTYIGSTTATGKGTITSTGSAAVTQHGHCWATGANPTISDSKTSKGVGTLGIFFSSITGLTANTGYHVRAYATNSMGTAYGDDVTFTSAVTGTPVVTTEVCTDMVTTTATGHGTIASIGASAVTQHGHCWDTTLNPTTTDSSSGEWGKTTNGFGFYGAFDSEITDLTVGTTYYIRAYATNTQGTAYGGNIILVAGGASSEAAGVYSTVRERFHYVGASGVEYYVQGEPV